MWGEKQEQTPRSSRALPLTLGVLLLASFAARFAASKIYGRGAIEGDGAGEVRIAENLRKGIGYISIMGLGPGLDLNTPPLFPFLISGASFLTRSYEQAGRLVSFVFGAFLPLPVFGVASLLFGRRTAGGRRSLRRPWRFSTPC